MPIATLIQSGDFASESVINAAIARDAVSTDKLQDGSVTTPKMADDAVTPAKVNPSVAGQGLTGGGGSALSVTPDLTTIDFNKANELQVAAEGIGAEHIGDNAIGSDHLKDGSVETEKLADDAVTGAKLAANAVGTGHMQDGAVSTAKLAAGSVSSAKLATDAVTSEKIAANAVGRSELDEAADYEFGGDVTFSNPITCTSNPTSDNHLANKSYVDGLLSGIAWKQPVKVASDSDVSIYEFLGSVDGVPITGEDRVLLFGQKDPSENGIYVRGEVESELVRANDLDNGSEFPNAAVFVQQGSFSDSAYVCTLDSAALLDGTDNIHFAQFSGAGQVITGDGIYKIGNTLHVGAGNGIQVAADTISVRLASDGGFEHKSGALSLKSAKGLASDSEGARVDISQGSGENAPGLEFDKEDRLKAKLAFNGGLKMSDEGMGVNLSKDLDFDSMTGQIKIAAGAVNGNMVAPDAIDDTKISDDAIKPEHLHGDTLALMKGYDARMSGTLTAGSADLVLTPGPTQTFNVDMPYHLLFLNGRLMEKGASLDYTIADNGDGSFTITFAQSAVAGDRYNIIFDSNP